MYVKGYKVFNPDWTCRGFQYKIGEIYKEDIKPILCERGFHFCEKAADCFSYYSFDPENKVAEVIALGEILSDGKKSCTNKIQIVREIPWQELLEIVNTGKSCTGFCNSGDYNSGDWNKCIFSNGCFNTESPKIYMFNKPSEWTYHDWFKSKARHLLNQIPGNVLEYIEFCDMTEKEKATHSEAETTGGYLKMINNEETAQEWYDDLSDEKKNIIKSIPNFDKVIFKEITGIDVED